MTIRNNRRGTLVFQVYARDLVPYMLLLFGLASLLTSAYYSSYILAFIGLGLVFWGALFLYIKSTKYVKIELLTAASSSGLDNIERMLATNGTDMKGIYLPPKNLRDYTSSLIFIPKEANQPLPKSAETSPQQLLSKNPAGLVLTPPGLALSKLFEKLIKRPFTETTPQELQTRLPKLFEELQITKSLIVETKDNNITIQTNNNIFKDLSEETKKLPRTYQAVGSPFSSALACVFAKATGRPVTIEKEEITPEGATIITYRILEN